jgi:hypothetical protein
MAYSSVALKESLLCSQNVTSDHVLSLDASDVSKSMHLNVSVLETQWRLFDSSH